MSPLPPAATATEPLSYCANMANATTDTTTDTSLSNISQHQQYLERAIF